ncbi:dystonin isoform X6 [Pieris napi]|uniref:dystonin isoform X6 n=1 Tax=Pieris napi TaxID=78633 RepID=UPI001FB88EE5|nr:dystonin isoform X6 [Pieris napi]
MSISDAVNRGQVDLQRGLYRLPNGTYITIAEAYQRGYLIYNEIIKIKSSALSLSDAISQELVDNSGWILDRNSGDRFQLDVAINNELINPNVREIVDHKNDTKVTLAEALEMNLINTKHSKYVHNVTKEKLSFKDAAAKRFICKPMTLKDICDKSLMTNDGKVLSAANKSHLSILEAISTGVLDSDTIKCVTDTTSGQLLTLSEALAARIILPDNKYRDNLTGEICSIPEAVDRGLITSVSQRSLFDIDGFRDPKTGEFVSFNVALGKGNLKYVNGETFLKSESGDFVFIEDCTKVSIVRPEVLEMFSRKIGVYESDKELTVLDAVFKGVLDSKTGYLLEPISKKPIPFNKAVEINIITPEGAALLNSLLNITLTVQTVTKTVKRYVTVTNTSERNKLETIITFSEAVRRGLIDENTQTFTDPTTGIVFPIQQALDEGILGVDQNDPRVTRISDRVTRKDLVPGQVVELKITKKSFIKELPASPESKVEFDNQPETVKSPDFVMDSKHKENIAQEVKTSTSMETEPSVTSLTIKKNTIELPRGGWTLKEAIQLNLFDPVNGIFVIPGTDRVLDFKEALKLNLINNESAHVVDLKTKNRLLLDKAVERHILDSKGQYNHPNGNLTMKDAIAKKYVLFISLSTSSHSQKVITFTSMSGMPDKMDVTDVQEPSVVLTEDQSVLEPVQVKPGVIYDPSTALFISTTSGTSGNIIEAIEQGLVPSDSVKILDPQTREVINLNQALNKGIVDKNTAQYLHESGQKISLNDAAKIGLVTVVGAPLVAASKIIQLVKSTMVVDHKTGEEVPMEVAYERGLVDTNTYKRYEESLREKTPNDESVSVPKDATDTTIQPKTIVSKSRLTVDTKINTSSDFPIKTQREYEINIMDPKFVELTDEQLNNKPKYFPNELNPIVEQAGDSKPTILQKLRKRVITVKEAYDESLVDERTATILNSISTNKYEDGTTLTLDRAMDLQCIDKNTGCIKDPIRGDTMVIKEALNRGMLDESGHGELLLPLFRPLTIPELLEQGLLDGTSGKIIHPESGVLLNLKEAIICDIVDPLSSIAIYPGGDINISEAILHGIIDDEKNIIQTSHGPADLLSATNLGVFPEREVLCDIPPAAMTLPIAIKYDLVNQETGTFKQPLTNELIPLHEAIEKKIIMAIPYPYDTKTATTLEKAFKEGLVNFNKGTFTDPKSKQVMSIDKALEQGLLIIEPNEKSLDIKGVITTITETFSSQHTVTTKMVELLSDYVLVNAKEVKNMKTGEIISIEEARQKGIVRDEQTKKEEFVTNCSMINFKDALEFGYINLDDNTFTHPNTGNTCSIFKAVKTGLLNTAAPAEKITVENLKNVEMLDLNEAFDLLFDDKTGKYRDPRSQNKMVTFEEALEQSIINAEGIIYDINSGKPVTLKKALKTGLLDKKTGKIQEPDSGKSFDIKEAAKMGLVAIVGAPVLAGMALVQGAKIVANKIMDPNVNEKTNLTENADAIKTVTEMSTRKAIIPIDKTENQGVEKDAQNKDTKSKLNDLNKNVKVKITDDNGQISKNDAEKVTQIYQKALSEDAAVSQQSSYKKTESFQSITESTNLVYEKQSLNDFQSNLKNVTTEFIKHENNDNVSEPIINIPSKTSSQESKDTISTDDSVTSPISTITNENNTLVKTKGSSAGPALNVVNDRFIESSQSDIYSHSPRQEKLQSKSDETLAESFKVTEPVSHVVEVTPGIVYDTERNVIISTETGRISDVISAVSEGRIPPDAVTILDPKSQQKINISVALSKGIINKDNGDVQDKSGKNISFAEAAKLGLVAIVGAPILAISKTVELVKDVMSEDSKPSQVLQKTEASSAAIPDKNGSNQVNIKQSEVPFTVDRNTLDSVLEFEKPKRLDVTSIHDIKTESAKLIDAEKQPLPDTEEIIENAATKEITEKPKILFENIPLIDAITESKIEPKICRIIVNGSEMPLTVQDSIDQEQISRFTPVDVISKSCVVVRVSQPKTHIAISSKLTPEELSEMRVYDIEKQGFVNPETGAKISFEELVYGLQVFDPSSILVKDLSSKSDTFIPFDEAIAKPIIDKSTGQMVNPKTGKRVSFLECVRIGWIVEKPEDMSILEHVSIETALEKGTYNARTGEIQDPNTGEIIPISDAIQKGVIDQDTLYITIPVTKETITILEAVDRGTIEICNGFITIIETQEIIEISVAIQKGILTFSRRPISIKAAIDNNMYEPISGKIKDSATEQLVSVGDAVSRNILHPTISEIKDTALEKYIPLVEAIETKLINPDTGKITDKKTGVVMPLDSALRSGLVATKAVTFSLFDIIELGYYSPDTCKILNPKSGEIVSLRKAIHDQLVDTSDVKIKDDKTETVVAFDQAAKLGLIDLEQGVLTSPPLNLKDAYEKGYLLNDKKPWTLQEGLVQGFYDSETGLLTINDKSMTLADSIEVGNINPEALTVRNSVTGEIISLNDAINEGIIDSKEGKVRDPIQGDKISLTDASERGLILPAKRKLSLPEAVFKGFYDPKTGKFSHPHSKEKVQTDRAIKKRMIDPQSTLVHVGGKVIPFEFAVDKGIVDGRTGTISLGDERVDFREAFERGILVEVRRPLSLIEALEKGVYNEITGLFMDPQSGKKYTLSEAIKINLIDPQSVHIQDNRLGKWDKITISECLETGVIDDESGKIKNINSDNEAISLHKAFEIGLLVDGKAPISLQRALHQGIYDDALGKIVDPITGRKITLHESIRRSIISPKYLCYFDKKSEKPLTLAECCRSDIIDRRSGMFKEPGSDVQISLSEAMSLGLIVDIESAGFSLYDALSMNMYNISELVFVHPVTDRKITLKYAIAEELINPETSLVKHIPSNKYIKLPEAIESGIVDENSSVYILPNGSQINLLDAKHRGLVVTSKKNLSLEEVIKNGLFRADNAKVVDPTNNEFVDIKKAIEIGLINPELTVVKDSSSGKFKPLLNAIQQGDVDVIKARVLDTKAKKTYSLDIAFDKGLLVTIAQPITSQTVSKRYVSEVTSKEPLLREFTLDEAIKYEFIDPETALIKDPHKNKYIPLKLGITEGIIDKNVKGLFDTQNPKTLCFNFENSLIVYVRQPLTFEEAIEQGHLNVSNARFIDPQSKEVLSIKDAAILGYIDSDTALIKDNLKKRLVKLPEAFRKGLMDAEKGNILDTETSKLNTLNAAIESGLLMTPKKSFSLIETINFGIYNPTTGALNDPFITTSVIDRKKLTLGDAIKQGIVDPSSTVVKDPETGKILPLVQAIEQQLINPVEGTITIDPKKGISLDLVKAFKKGYLLPAETRQAVEEKYRLCDETLSKLLEWIAVVEERLANQEAVKEDMDEIRNQINILKLIKDDLDSHQRQVSACADQAKQLLVSGSDVLAPHEVAALERGVRQLKQRCDKCTDKCDKMLRKLVVARDELGKFTNELNAFNTWMEGAYRTLEDKEVALSKVDNLAGQSDEVRDFVSDVIAHQADLRFITMAAQKFVDESKEFLNILNDYRTSLPARLSHVPVPVDSAVREHAGLARRRHGELASRAQRLLDRLRMATDGSSRYREAVQRAQRWMQSLEPQIRTVLSEGVAGEPRAVESQLSRAKTLHNEILSQGRLIDNVKDACEQLVKSLEGNLTPSEIRQLEVPVIELQERYKEMSDAVAGKCGELESALLQCQGIQDAAETQANWLNQAENNYKTQTKPASLIRERLEEQIREQRISQAEVEGRRAALAQLQAAAREAALTPSNARIANKLEQRAQDIFLRYEKLVERVTKRGQFLDEVMSELSQFNQLASRLETTHAQLTELDSRDLARMSSDELASRLADLAHSRDKQMPLVEECLRLGKQLVAKKDVTDTHVVRDRMKAIENQWRDFNTSLEEKQKLSKQKSDQLNQYETLRSQVLEWLQSIENRINHLRPVAIDMDVIKQQHDELRPLAKEYRDFSITIDKLNEAGAAYEALSRGDRADSPRRRHVYSPTKRHTPSRTLDTRSPSPGKGGVISPASAHSASSGFSSRRSSQDGFHLEDLSPVQQQVSEVNNRYELVGAKLSDRQSELDAMKEEVKRHLDSFRTLNNFLDKVQRQLPKESVPTTKEEADKTIKQARAVLEEMYEKQSILDSTKTQVRELLKRKQSVQGADRLHDELQDVASRWKALHDAFKEKIQLMEEMKDLLDTHSSLSGWLSAKERMMTALGPISSDSRMVQTQVQQVQVLREEFRSQQPQLSHLVDVAGSALQKLPHDDPDVKRLTKKVQDLQDRWNDLLNKLEQRADSLGAAADTSREFDAGLERLRNALHSIGDKLDDVTTRQEPADQLREVENLERQLEGQRPLLADLEAAGATLAEVLGDASSRQDIQSKLAAAVRQYDQLQRKLDNRKAEIEAALKDGRNVEESVARTLGWLQSELGTLPARLLVSADKPRLQQALDTHEPLYRGLTQREHEIIMLLDKGREMEKKPAFSGLRKDLDRIQSQWEKLKRETVDRYNRLQTAMEHCRKYNKAQESFLPWLGEAEKQLRELPAVAFTRKELERQLRDLQHIRNDVWKRSGEYENNRTLGETFISACDVDQEIVRNQLDSMKEKWDRINNEVLQQIEYLESTSRKLGDFLEKVRAVEAPLARCEERLEAALNSAPAAAKDAVARLTDHVHALHAPLQSVNMAADDIVSIANEFAGPEAAARARQVLDETTKSLADRLRDLETSTLKAGEEMAGVAKAITYFLNNVKESQDLISNLEKEFDAMKPPGRDLKTVRAQIDEISKFWTKLESGEANVDETARTADIFDDSPHSEFAKPQEHIAPLKEKIRKLQQKTRQREQDLDDTHSKLQAFYKVYDAVIDDIDEATEQVRNLKPVSSDLDQIRAQQKDFADLKQRTVEPLGQNVSHCNKIGQGLVRSALQGVSTQELDKDLEKLNDRWNNLKEKMNERGRRLDVGLLQSGKLAEALAGLARWLSDTEELVRNQKPPSADYKVVKAQLQEQKFLKKMLMDRQNSMSSLFAMGNEVAADCDSNEKKAIEKQLKGLMLRFDGLTASAQQRMLDLEQAMKVAKTFEEQLQPLMEWLGVTERKVNALELVPTDEEKIQQKIREHKNIHEDILSKQPQFKELTETASTLMSLVGDDEAAALADRLHLATDRYQALVDHSLNIGDLLDNSRKGLRHLVLTYQDLSAWMDSMEQYLAKRKILPVHMEKLLRQMDELAEKTEEISDKQQAVDSTVESGLELMKHISGDEALQLKDKLDALQRRYNDLTAKGADLLRLASDTLPLVQQLYNSHTKLTEWMASAETCLQSVEPREQDILRLEAELQEFRPLLDNINVVGPQLCQISPGEGATHVEGMVTRDNRRFDAIAEQVQRKAERLLLSKKRSLEVVGDMEELVEWLRAADAQLRAAEPPAASADVLRAQLAEQRPLSDDVAAQRVRARELLSQAKKVLRECQSGDEASVIRERSEELKEMMEEVGQLSAARLAALEQALPLAEHFADTHHGLSSWLDDMEKQVQMLAMPALRPEQIVQQQDKNEMLQQSIAGHKPLVDKLVKTGEALSRLCGEDDAAKVQDIVENDCERYNALKAELRQRQQELEQALQESSVFAERLEGMVRALSGAADQLQRAEPVSAHPHKIQDQIEENNALIEDLEKREEAYKAVQRAASDVMSKASATDPAVRDIRGKLEKLNKLWDEVQRTSNNRGQSLESALELARRFWEQLEAVMGQLGELEDTLAAQPPPAAQPHHIQHQQLQLQEIRQEIDHTKPEVEKVRKTGSTLMSICGEPDKPEVKKHIEDLDTAWDNITALYARREENLIDAMEKAMEFHDTLHNLQEFLDTAEDKFSRMGPLGSDIDAVKRQISQLAGFKTEVDPHMVKVEALNRSLMRQAAELTERTSSEQAAAIKQPLTEVNGRWSSLLRGMVERQQQLEKALLRLGQLQHALRDILAWIQHTNDTLDTLAPVAGDPQILEVELAKLKVVMNDIAAHQASVDTLNEAGAHIVHHGTDEAGETAEKLATLNKKWRELQQKARDRQSELEDALREAQSFNAEIGDLLSWLSEVDSVVVASKPVGGLPETATEQLERFMEVYHEIEANRPKVEAVLQQGQEYIKRQEKPNPTSQLHLNLKNLKSRWDNVTLRASDKKIKLEIALKEATEFHEALQAFVDWLTSAEKTLTSAKPVSRVMETLLTQVEEHKAFQKEVSTHRETMLQLDKKGTHLKYFSQKQDVILIKNLLVSVQHRWERVVSKAAERTRALDHGIKEAKEFNDMWNNLMNWLNDTEQQLDQLNAEANVNDPEKIKQRLTKHREFQKALASKQPAYDLTSKTGKTLKDKAPKSDEPVLREKLAELKSKWTTVCSKAVDRQRRLEEALLYSGQFKDAMSALLEWLRKQEKDLSSESPLHGDLDTVMALIEQHKQFEEDLHSREQQMQSVMKTGRDLEATVPAEDALSIKQQCSELQQAWDTVFTLSERKAHKLETALKEAERLHKSVNMLLEWLSDAETKLRFTGQLPEGEQETQQQIRDHERFIKELNEKKRDKDDTISLAHSILGKAHPDAVTVIKHWITIIQSRWDEVWQWAMQRGGKLETHMQSLKDLDLVLEELLQWLSGLETTLITLEAEPLPESIEVLEGLIEDHKDLMEHTQKRQNEVDRVCKAYQVKSQSVGRESTPRKVSAKSAIKGTPGRGSQHDLHRDRSMSPDYYGSRRIRSRIHSRSSRRGSVGAEPEFRSSRVKQLWDKWRHIWLLAWERQRRLHDRLMHLRELQRVSNFSWDEWRKRFLKFMNHKKSRLTDLFRKMDKDNHGMIARNEFIDGIINTKFDTSRLEMGAVADLFDRNGSGLIDWEEFIAALRPDWVERRGPPTDADKIHDEVKRLVMLCTCRQKFRVFQVGEGKYRFGDSQKLRLVRILRSTVMVRVGGGWVALDEFLVKNDPCRAEEFMEQLRPIFEALRQREELPCSYPLHVGSTHGTKQAFIYGHSRSQGSTTPGAHHYTHQHGYQPSPGYHWVRERTARSVPMSAGGVHGRASRSSLSAGTPDSLSDNEAASGLGQRYRKPSVPRSTLTPGGSRPGSRPGSRTGSKPPSRHGSNLSLDSTDDVSTPSRIPMRKVTNTRASLARAAATANKLGVSTPNGGSRPRTPTGILTPASGRYHSGAMYRTSSIPTLSPVPALVSSTHSQPSSMASEPPKSLSHNHPAFQTQGTTKIPIYVGNRSQRSVSTERRLKSGKSRETSQDPSPMSQDPKSDQRSPEDDSSLFSISGMTSDNECESNISESSGDASKPKQRDAKGSGSFASTDGYTPGRSRIPVPKEHITNTNQSRQRTPSGSTTPVRSGQQTAVSRLLRKTSDASDSGTPTTPVTRRTSTTTRTTDKREPFRL